MRKLINWLKSPEWSPYAAGAGLGLLGIFALLFTDQIFGASGAFENVGGAILNAVAPSLADNTYWNYVMPAAFVSFGVIMLIGIFLGSLISALISGSFKWRAVSDDQWARVFGPSVWKRWGALFLGAIFLEYGAGIAGGCTSGLAISGGVQLAPAAFLFMAGMFASGITTAIILYGKRY
ncbi:MAG TPA: YeeE/YedE family protein [Chloroflexi bacterium]|nr:YeeE/YedE family protein [Chloroflexota bacterium]